VQRRKYNRARKTPYADVKRLPSTLKGKRMPRQTHERAKASRHERTKTKKESTTEKNPYAVFYFHLPLLKII
jgi:hypothetical protein